MSVWGRWLAPVRASLSGSGRDPEDTTREANFSSSPWNSAFSALRPKLFWEEGTSCERDTYRQVLRVSLEVSQPPGSVLLTTSLAIWHVNLYRSDASPICGISPGNFPCERPQWLALWARFRVCSRLLTFQGPLARTTEIWPTARCHRFPPEFRRPVRSAAAWSSGLEAEQTSRRSCTGSPSW